MKEKKPSFSLDLVQEMWESDSKMNQDELDSESLKIPQLHAKYYDIYNVTLTLRKQTEISYSKILLERRQYYQGKATADIYAEEPFPYKVRDKEDLKLYLDADKRLKDVSLKKEYYDMMLRYLEEILKQITNRTYQIKNAIEWRRFTSGYG
tara:strand:+ start:5800 stop:6252 length:453 start_codon:yes stop_codon:yes gene_type:complete